MLGAMRRTCSISFLTCLVACQSSLAGEELAGETESSTSMESAEGATGEEPHDTDDTDDTLTDGSAGESEGTGDTGDTDTEESGETGEPDPPQRPADAPDWLVITVSGHCIPPGCELPGTNHEYIADLGTAARFVDALEAWGEEVQLWSYTDELYNRDLATQKLLPGEGDPIFYGFLQLHEDLLFVRDAWVGEFDDPTKILVIAHSHGVVWAHTALHVVDDLPIEVMIDLDGKSLAWESENLLLSFGDDWSAEIAAYNEQHGVSWPFDIGDAEAGWDIPGQGSMDVEDVIPDSVVHNLEIQATSGIVMPFPDTDDNRRLDGTRVGITTFVSEIEDHVEIDNPDAQAIDWALAQFAQLAVP